MAKKTRSAVSMGMAAAMFVGAQLASVPVHALAVANSLQDVYTGGTATLPSTHLDGFTGEMLTVQATDVGMTSAEPTIGVDRDGVAFFAAATLVVDNTRTWGVAQTHVMRSVDGGLSWARVQNSVPAANLSIPLGNLDPFVWVDPATGRVFNIDLYGGCSWLNYSDDHGATWQVNPAACGMPVNDHQTIGSGAPRGGYTTLGYPNILYYCANQILETGCGRSLNGGLVWTPTMGAPFPPTNDQSGCGALTGHIRTDPEGRVFLPNGGCVNPWVAISDDAGDTWSRVKVSNLKSAVSHTSISSDSAGNLYYVFLSPVGSGTTTKYLPFLSISRDHGQTWGDAIMVAPPGVNHVNFPVITAGDGGRIAINFPGTTEPKGNVKATTWNQYLVVSDSALASNPVFVSATGNDPSDPVHRGPCRSRCDGLWDFLDIVVSPSGQAWASAADDCVAACVNPGTLVSLHAGEGIAIRQIGGPSLRDPIVPPQ